MDPEIQAEQQKDETPAWLVEARRFWYHPDAPQPIIEQALKYACYGIPERMDYWRRAPLMEGCESRDGYLPGVSWSPPGYPAQRLSVSRFVATLREAYRPKPLKAEVHMKERQAFKMAAGGWEMRGVEQRAWLQSLAEALGGRLRRVS